MAELVDANQIVYQDESYPLEVCAEITYIGSNPVLTTKKCYCGSDLLQPSDDLERRANLLV